VISLSWGMLLVLLLVGAGLLGAFFWGLERIITQRLDAHLVAVRAEVIRLASVTDGGEAQYRTLGTRVATLAVQVEIVDKKADSLRTDVDLLKQRVGLTRPAADQ
jgi:hypothetical protein